MELKQIIEKEFLQGEFKQAAFVEILRQKIPGYNPTSYSLDFNTYIEPEDVHDDETASGSWLMNKDEYFQEVLCNCSTTKEELSDNEFPVLVIKYPALFLM